MTLKLTSGASLRTAPANVAIRVVIVTMDTHLASAVERARRTLKVEPGRQLDQEFDRLLRQLNGR